MNSFCPTIQSVSLKPIKQWIPLAPSLTDSSTPGKRVILALLAFFLRALYSPKSNLL